MTFSTNVPNASQSPGLFPAQMNTDLNRLKLIVRGNHQFNDTVGVPNSDGFHNRVDYINPAVTPTIPTAANATGYTGLITFGSPIDRTEAFIRNTQGSMLITGCRASVVFTGRNTNGVCVLTSFYNITSVTRDNVGIYSIVFNVGIMASNTYTIMGSCQGATAIVAESKPSLSTTAGTTLYVKLCASNAFNDLTGDKIHVFFFGG